MRLEVGKWLGPFKGTTNDKTMVRSDPFITTIGEEDIFADFKYVFRVVVDVVSFAGDDVVATMTACTN